MSNTDQAIAVIGGSGFVGSAVMRQARDRGLRVINLDIAEPRSNAPGEWQLVDITKPDMLIPALAGCSDVIFLAAEWRDNVRPLSRYTEVNVEGVRNVIAACRLGAIRRMVFVSSCSVYGPTPHEVDETFAGQPINPYGESKAAGEALLQDWAASDPSIQLVIVRPTVIFGPGNRGNVWNLANQVINGPFIMIGDGENRKSMAYVENVAAFLLHARQLGTGTHIYNYSDKPDFTMNELVDEIRKEVCIKSRKDFRIPINLALAGASLFDLASKIIGREFGINSERVFKFSANTQYSAARAFSTGFSPPFSLRDGLKHMIATEFRSENFRQAGHE